MYLKFFQITIFLLVAVACTQQQSDHQEINEKPLERKIKYATRFNLIDSGAYQIVDVIWPKNKKRGVDFKYALLPEQTSIDKSLVEGHKVSIPLQRFTVRSAGEAAMLTELEALDGVVGISSTDWIANKTLQKRYAEGAISVVGRGNTINEEVILQLQPDGIFEIGTGSKYDITKRLLEMELTPIMNCIYWENHPLAMAEWIKYYGAFLNKQAEAEAVFDTIAQQYEALVAKVKDVEKRPKVIVGRSKRGTWSTHGSSEWFIRYIIDAGGEYILEDSAAYEENLISMEQALIAGQQADFWINPMYTVEKLEELLSEDSRYQYFKSVKEGKVYNNNNWVSEGGRNHYWEEGVIQPHLILADLIKIFHPTVLPDHELVYYRQIK